MKLQLNNKIKVHGFVMLKGVEGELKVSKIDEISYWFTKPKGTKVVCRHLISDIDMMIKNSDDNNRIELLIN